jgi:hypothetical protein
MKQTLIDITATKLRLAVEEDQRRPEESREESSATAVFDEDRFIVVSGSAHQMKECFKLLLKERPELLSVMRWAIDESYRFLDH